MANRKNFSELDCIVPSPENIAEKWKEAEKSKNTLAMARMFGLQGTDEQIYAFTNYIELHDRAQHHLMNMQRISHLVGMRDNKIDDLAEIVHKNNYLLKKVVKDFYETYEVKDDE